MPDQLLPLLEKIQEAVTDLKQGQVRTEERLKVVTEGQDYTKNAIHAIRNNFNDHAIRLKVAEDHIEACKAEHKVAAEIRRSLQAQTDALKSAIQTHDLRNQRVESDLANLKGSWSGVLTKAWSIIQAVGLAYLSYKLGWGH